MKSKSFKDRVKNAIAIIGIGILATASLFGLAGCGGQKSNGATGETSNAAPCQPQYGVSVADDRFSGQTFKYKVVGGTKNEYIVVSENGVDTLHKGSVDMEYFWNYGTSMSSMGYAYSATILRFNCGKQLKTSQYVGYMYVCPEEDKYDKVCECAKSN